MKRGSKALHCYKCNKIVGWEIPTGKAPHGIPEVTIKMKQDGHIVDKAFSRYFYCSTCNKLLVTR